MLLPPLGSVFEALVFAEDGSLMVILCELLATGWKSMMPKACDLLVACELFADCVLLAAFFFCAKG